ncbi:MAG TPA: HlyD family efflux transporter periplasmic adaptor subunit [Noviherbaspirillum sp.]|uniref:efflux RND transporter periplasmic adaptor subunit n=1 Tax=Noviherbaspirillum sp. TaxID=1926288 RepID=UPI002D3E99CB|nr:HlyD family efflux transporter periplasmic adaptor subunit [Noviherbaspirillum sp.]HYD97110.1 HlyD family efflux transporter periplasmic adaptor subunit [Noviherbaspirillum sp.]
MSAPDPTGGIGDLLAFERTLRRCRSRRELLFCAVNDSHAVLRFDQAVLWAGDALRGVRIEAVSGLADLDANGPYALWLERVFAHLEDRHGGGATQVREVRAPDLPEDLLRGHEEWLPEHCLYCGLASPEGKRIGGLWLTAHEAFDEGSRARAEWLAEAVGFSLWAWQRDRLHWRHRLRLGLTRRQKFAAAAAAAVFLVLPVRLSALAPAEVVPEQPVPITAPADGIVQQILVAPNQPVAAGQPLLQLDDTALRNRVAVAQKSLEIVRAERQRAASKAFSDDASKAELQMLDARVAERAAELQYLADLRSRLQITAPRAGIAIFSNADEWRGKAVQTGERLMTLADPSRAAVSIALAPDDAIRLEVGSEVKLYLNAAPLSSFDANIVQTAYETGLTPEGMPAYMLRAHLAGGETPRIGLKGTAKISAGWVPLSYYLLRKPLRALRRAVGL